MAKQVSSPGQAVLLPLLLLLSAVTASPHCKTGCQKRSNTFQTHYEVGHTYVYNFEGHTIGTLPGQQGDGIKLHLKATAEVSLGDDCKAVLNLKNVQVTGPDSQKYTHLTDLEAHPVGFNFENGIVEQELCTEAADSEASINLKRAVISLFQVAPQETTRSGKANVLDVFGLCPTDISYSERGGTITILKSRNLNKCHLREHLRQDFASITYRVESDFQTTPLLESTQEIKQQLKGGVLNSAESHEKYLYRPFANQDAGSKTLVDSKLTLVSHSQQASPATGSVPRSIVFEPPRVGTTSTSNAAAVVEALHKAHKAMPDYVGETAAREFSHVVDIIRHTSKDDLLTVYGQVKAGAGFKDKNAGTKMFLDALFRAGTGPAVEVAVELLKSNKITGPYAEMYYLQFAYTKYVSLSAVTAAASLLDQPNLSKLAYLGIGALAGRYCASHNCDNVPEFDAFLEKLSHPLDGGCKPSNYDEEVKIVAVLKALKNVHHLNDAVVQKLRTCVLNDNVPTRLRSAVLDVFQTDACRVKETSLEVLRNHQLDSELRIKAFLALVECPCNKMSNPLKELLDAEPTYQVGAFITSYLRNLRASANPAKQQQKDVYGQIRTTKRFPLDLRKFSNNFEVSHMLGGLNLGTTVESSVVYSQMSFAPRMITLNLTTQLFGHMINIGQVELRQENLDLIAESLVGPKGYLNTHPASQVVKDAKDGLSKFENTVKQRVNQSFRSKRSVTKEALEEVRHKSTSPFHAEPDRELSLELSGQLFGAEVIWANLHHNAKDAAKNAFDTSFNILDKVFKKAKDFQYGLRQHNTFLDTELIYPTSLGFPLKLVASGSSALHVELEGKIDANQLVNDFKNSHVHFRFVPSAAVEVVGAFVVDAYAVEAGYKVAATLHTATGTDINIKSTDGAGIDVTLGLPVKKQDVVTLKSEVLTTVQERGKTEVNTAVTFPGTPRRDYHGCFDQLSPILGITFCGAVEFPWDPVASKAAFYPLNGHSKVSFVVENEDVNTYHFRASVNDKDPHKRSVELLLETPGSKTDRKLGLVLERTYDPFHGVKAELTSPWKRVSGELAFTDSDKELSLLAKLLNDADEYSVKVGASVTGDTSHATYHPLLEYKTPEKKASLVSKKGTKGSPEKLTQPFTVSGSVTVDKADNAKKYTFNDVVFSTPHGEYKVDGTVASESGNSFSTDLKVYYGENHVVLKSGFKRPAPSDLHVNVNVQPSQYPDFGVNLIWDYKRDKHNLQNSLALVHGRDPNSPDARFTLQQEAHYQFENLQSFDFSTKNKVSYPLLGIVGKVDASVVPNKLHVDLEASYEKHKFESELTAKTGIHKRGDYEVDFHAKVLDSSLEFETKREIVSPEQSKFTTELQVQPGGKYQVVADVTHVFDRNNINFQLDAVANIHGQSEPYKLDSGLVYNQQLFDSHCKLSVGSVDYIDVSANFKRAAAGNPSGNAKVFLKNYLVGNAQYKFAAGKGSATLNIDVPKLSRKLKGTGDLQITGTHHVATVELYYNADKNPNQKLTFHTDTDLKKDALDSKNVLNILDYKTEVNVKGTLTGKLQDGQLKGEFDATLACGSKLTGKLDQTLHVRPTNSEGDVKAELTLTPSGSAPAKVTLEVAGKNVDTKQYLFDGQSKLAFHAPSGKDVAVIVAAKNIPQREKRVVEAQTVLQGSLVGEPLRVEFNSEVYEPHVTYKGHASYGTSTVVDLKGTVKRTLKLQDNHYTGPFSAENTLEIKCPFEKVQHIKVDSSITGELEEKKLQFHYKEVLNVDGKVYELNLDSDNELEKGSNKLVLVLPNTEPRTYISTWYFNYDDFKHKDIVKGGFSLAGNHDSKLSVDLTGRKDWSDLNVHAILNTPLEKLKNAELNLKNKYNPAPRLEVDTDLTLTVDDKKFTIVNKLTPGPFQAFPNIDFTSTHPGGKTRVYFVLQSKSDHDVSGRAELEWPTNGGGKLTASGKATYESFHNFKVEADVESAKLSLKKWHVLLSNKPGKTAKTITIQATEAGTPVINGKLEYHVDDKPNSYKAGVSGNVKVRDQNQHLQADVFFNKFTPTEHGELGAESGVSIHLGDKTFDASNKYTNKESRAKVSLCHKAGDCSVFEAHSVFKVLDFSHLEHDFGAKLDLKASGVNEGFVAVGKTVRKPLSFDHSVELKLLNAKQTTYKLHSFLNEKAVGVVVTLPQRIIAAEGTLGHVKEKGERKLDLNFWLDKERHPEEKAALHLLGAFNPSKEGTTFQAEAKFSHPALQKDFSVTSSAVLLQNDILLDATVDFDVFAKKNQKVTVVAKLLRNQISNGFNVTGYLGAKGRIVDANVEGGAELSSNGFSYLSTLTYQDEKHKTKTAQVEVVLTLNHQYVHVKSPTSELLKLDRQVTKVPHGLTIKGEVFVVGVQPVEFDEAVTFPTSRKATIHKKNEPNKKLLIEVLHDFMTGFSVRLTTSTDGANKDVLYVGVDLTDEHFLRTHFTWSTEDLKKLLELAKHDAEDFLKQLKVVSKDFGNEVTDELQGLMESVKKATPDVKGVVSSYQTQLKALREELENDEGFTEASENMKKVAHAITKVVVEISKRVTELVDHALEVFTKLRTAVQESFSKLLPKLKELYTKFVEFSTSIVSFALENGSKVVLKVADFIKENEDEIKKLVEVTKDFIEDIGKVVGKTIVQVRNEVVGFVKLLVEQVKALPIYANFKEQYSHFVSQLKQQLVPEQTWSVIKEVLGPFKDSLPTSELRDLITAAEEYVDKHLNKQPVNDSEELQALLNKAIKALKSLLSFITSHLPKGDPTKEAPSFLGLRLPLAVNALFELPRQVAFKFSPIQLLTSGGIRELPTLQEFLLTLKPTLNPLEWVPPFKGQGVLIDLSHFVSLDGRHFTFKGTCSYVLLQDVVDGNFSVALDFASKSLVISDHHDTVELSEDSTFKANGKPAEFPFASGDIVAWKDFGAVNVMHQAGLFVKCDTHQSYCLFTVNGFYFGKTRGLLGVLNYEPFDDFKEPSGKVVTDVNEFGNSWKVDPSCGDVSGATHHDHHMQEPTECANLYARNTPLKLGYLFSAVAPYREACTHFVADETTPEGKKQAACATAAAYVASTRSQYIPISLPAECAHCPVVGGAPLEVGDTLSVRVPQKAADVVIVVEQVLENNEIFKDLVTPLVTTLTAELNAKGISDVHFTLIGYGEATHNYPTVYTSNGKITFEGKTKNMKFTDHIDNFDLKLDTCENKFKYLKAVIESELGLGAPSRAYQFASKYPFKVGTTKVLVGVVGTTRTSAFSFSLQQLGALYSTKVLRDRGVAFHLVAPVEDVQLANSDAKTLKSVVGFDSDHVYLLSDAKKKEGSTELRKNLSYKNNIWIPIALESYGTAYVAQNFVDAKAQNRKQFLQVFSHRIADSLLTPLHEDCTCKLVDGLHAFANCKVTSRQEREPLSGALVKGKGVKG